MLQRIYRVYLRYCEGRVRLRGKGALLRDKANRVVASLDDVDIRGGRLGLSGRSPEQGVRVRVGAIDLRADRNADGLYHIECPAVAGPIELSSVIEGDAVKTTALGISRWAMGRAYLAQLGPFVCSLVIGLPDLWRWKRRGDMGARTRLKERLGFALPIAAVEMDARQFERAVTSHSGAASVAILLPVFNARDLLEETLARVEQHTDVSWHLVIVEDCSTDPDVRPFLQEWASDPERADRVTLLLNDVNLGFVRSVNRALGVASARSDSAVVLLNSDAFVPARWASRLIAPILSEPNVASVTPFSNDAEIFSVPSICQRSDLGRGLVDQIDATAAQFGSRATDVDAPTGVGFCMAMSPTFLAKVPSFDEIFGRGYGEETDWCQRVAKVGGRHVVAANVFVEHAGGASFGSATKQKLLERNGAIIRQRYPNYESAVDQFISTDPLVAARLAVGMGWASSAQNEPVPIYVAHALGGGAEHDLQHRLEKDLGQGIAAVVLRVGQGHRWQVELHVRPDGTERSTTIGLTNETGLVKQLLSLISHRRVIYSCGVGATDPLELPDVLCELGGEGHSLEVLFHDFFPVSPVYTLVPAGQAYDGAPVSDPGGAHRFRAADKSWVTLTEWQTAWSRLMDAADRAIVFSDSSAEIVSAVYPVLGSKLSVEPHTPELPNLSVTPQKRSDVRVIGVLGNIGWHKGAEVLSELSRAMARDGRARLVVLGQLDPDFGLVRPSVVHGTYDQNQIPDLVRRYGIEGWFMPSIWPETYSFVVHEMLETGLPVTAFDIGAQADAVLAAGGRVLPTPGQAKQVAPQDVLEALDLD